MTLRSGLSTFRKAVLTSVHTRPMTLGHRLPIVSFCFDDFPRSAYIEGGAILKSFGVRGTYYAALGLMNTANSLGDQLTPSDIESLLKDGHELGSHTFSHSSCRSVSLNSFESDVSKGREAIRELTGYDAGNFAYPYGHVSVRSKGKIGVQMNSARGIYGGVNGPTADLNLLRANSLYGDVDQCLDVELLIAEAVRTHGWLIFYTHDVRQSHSPFGCTPELLRRAVLLAEKSGCCIASIKAAMTMFRASVPEPAFDRSAGHLGPACNTELTASSPWRSMQVRRPTVPGADLS